MPLPSFPWFVVQRVFHQKFFLDSVGCAIFHDVIVQKPSAFKILLCYQKGGSGGVEVVVLFIKSISFWRHVLFKPKARPMVSHRWSCGVLFFLLRLFPLSLSLLPSASIFPGFFVVSQTVEQVFLLSGFSGCFCILFLMGLFLFFPFSCFSAYLKNKTEKTSEKATQTWGPPQKF